MRNATFPAAGPPVRRGAARVAAALALALGVAALHAWLLGARKTPATDFPVAAARAAATGAATLEVRQIHAPSNPLRAPATQPVSEVAPLPLRATTRRAATSAAAPEGHAGLGGRTQPLGDAPLASSPRQHELTSAAPALALEVQELGATPVEPPPVYPTRVPASTQLRYALQRGAANGEARLNWRADADRYELDLHATLPNGAVLEQRSQGEFDAAGLAPLRLADRRRGRDLRAANFQRDKGLVSFSGPRLEWPLQPGAQDRLSWLVQLVAIASAAPDGLREGATLSMMVVGARGTASRWQFQVQGLQATPSAQGEREALLLQREPVHPYDLRVEVWLDPARNFWPLRVRQTQVPGGQPLEWLLLELSAPRTIP